MRPILVVVLLHALIVRVGSLHIVFGAHNIPHPAKASTGGEDAFFFDDRLGTFGIADGVGGSRTGDPGEFSREVLRRCHQSAEWLGGDAEGEAPKVADMLQMASEAPIALGGSTTLLLGQLEASRSRLTLLNLGDSGAMVLRPSLYHFGEPDNEIQVLFPRCVLRSQDQLHGFNWPYQASARNLDRVTCQLDELTTHVREGDVLIAATDGLLDNLFDQEIQATVSEQLTALMGDDPIAAQQAISCLAWDLTERANAVGLRDNDPALTTPWMATAAEAGYQKVGGKLDDVAVVCGVVRQGERPALRVEHNLNGGIEGQFVAPAQHEDDGTPPAPVAPSPAPAAAAAHASPAGAAGESSEEIAKRRWLSGERGIVMPTNTVPLAAPAAPSPASAPMSEYEKYMASRMP